MIKKKIILTFLIYILIGTSVHAKDSYSSVKDALCQRSIDSISNSIIDCNKKSIVYGVNSVDFSFDVVLIIMSNKTVRYWCLKNDSILNNGTIKSDSMFLYRMIKMSGARRSEEFSSVTFLPPVFSGVDTEFVVYKDRNKELFFEYGKNICFYKPNHKFEVFRREWLCIIRKELREISVFPERN